MSLVFMCNICSSVTPTAIRRFLCSSARRRFKRGFLTGRRNGFLRIALLILMMSEPIAFDTAAAFSMSFGIAKFALAQEEAKLVGEIVGRYGRRPNLEMVRAIKKWHPIYTVMQLQDLFRHSEVC